MIETDEVLVCNAKRLGGLHAHDRGVIPRELGERIRKFLQPAIISKTAVVKGWRRQEDDLQSTRRSHIGLLVASAAADCAREFGKGLPCERGHDRRKLAAGQQSVV